MRVNFVFHCLFRMMGKNYQGYLMEGFLADECFVLGKDPALCKSTQAYL
ncbi:hypothetical protein ABIE50_005116 [Chitinophaga sp. OAE865]